MSKSNDETIQIDKAFFKAARALIHSFKDNNFLSNFKIDRAQYYTLVWLDDLKTARLKDLAQSMDLDQSTVSRHVNQLENLDLVKKQNDETDLRSCLVTLTAKGKNLLRAIECHRRALLKEAIKSWPKSDRETFGYLLDRLSTDLNSLRENKEEK